MKSLEKLLEQLKGETGKWRIPFKLSKGTIEVGLRIKSFYKKREEVRKSPSKIFTSPLKTFLKDKPKG